MACAFPSATVHLREGGVEVLMTFTDANHSNNMLKQLHDMQKSGLGTDVCLESGDQAVSCHRVLLMAASPHFRDLFSRDEAESGIIDVPDVHSSVLEHVVEFMYTARCDITRSNLQHLIMASKFLGLETLKAACEDALVNQMTPANCIKWMDFGQRQALPNLEAKAKDVMRLSLREVADSRDFLTLTPDQLIAYISDKDLDVPNEDIVFLAVMKWLKKNQSHTENTVENIIKHVRLPFCTPFFLSNTVRQNPLFRKDPFLAYFQEASDYQALGEKNVEMKRCCTQQRSSFKRDPLSELLKFDVSKFVNYTPLKEITLFGGISRNDNSSKQCYSFDSMGNDWMRYSKLPSNTRYYSICEIPEGLLLTGGDEPNSSWCHMFKSFSWSRYSDLKSPRSRHASICHDNQVFVFGGVQYYDDAVASVEFTDLRYRGWVSISDMPVARYHPQVAKVGPCIYVLGGVSGSVHDTWDEPDVVRYDTRTRAWDFVTPMPKTCQLGSAVAVKEEIFILGGYNRSCMKYNTNTDTWALLSRPQDPCGFCATLHLGNGRILVGGGINGDGHNINDLYEYNVKKNRWSDWKGAKLPRSVSNHFLFYM